MLLYRYKNIVISETGDFNDSSFIRGEIGITFEARNIIEASVDIGFCVYENLAIEYRYKPLYKFRVHFNKGNYDYQ